MPSRGNISLASAKADAYTWVSRAYTWVSRANTWVEADAYTWVRAGTYTWVEAGADDGRVASSSRWMTER